MLPVLKVSFSPDGTQLITGHDDGSVAVRETDINVLIQKVCSRLLRDFNVEERERYGIGLATSTCSLP